MERGFDGTDDQPRSEYDYFIDFYSGRFHNMVRVLPDETVYEAYEKYMKACKDFRFMGYHTERKDLSTLLYQALKGMPARRNPDKDTDIDIIKSNNRFDY